MSAQALRGGAEHASPADHAACRALIRGGSKSFFAASLLLPREIRAAALALYAFCRLADDAVDHGGTEAVLEHLQGRLARIYQGTPADEAADRALADVVARYAIPQAIPAALLEGFAWDAAGRRFETLEALEAYAVRVAGTVGVMMACLMGARSRGVLARACDLGVAMQLTNIARDVGEDARAGRLYLPLQWLREAGLEPAALLAAPRHGAATAQVVRRLLERADVLYARALSGIAALPNDCRAGIHAAARLYAAIGNVLAARGYDGITRRAVVPGARKLVLLGRALLPTGAEVADLALEPLPQAAFLVDAVLDTQPARTVQSLTLDAKVAWLVDLFERLERAERSHFSERVGSSPAASGAPEAA